MRNKRTSPYHINLGGIEVKVFEVGGSPRIRTRKKSDPLLLQGIHTHFTHEIFFAVNGRLKLVTEDYTRTFERSVLIIPPRLKHSSFPDAEGNFCLLFSIEDTPAGNALKEKLQDGITDLPITEDIVFFIRKLAEKCAIPTAAAERDCIHLAALIFNEVFAALSPEKQTAPGYEKSSREHISAIDAFINANLRKKFTLSDVAKSVFLSTKQIARIIEREYGMTFSEMVAEKRLAAAELLLKNTDLKIAEIAARTFPGTESYFYTLFKKKYGMSPLRYRKETKLF